MTIWKPDLAAGRAPRYLGIADAIAADVAAGRLSAGDRLPPQRELADALGIAIGTVTRAYAEAERRGLVRGEVGRGTFVGDTGEPHAALSVREPAPAQAIDLSLNLPMYGDDPDLAVALRSLARRQDLGRLLRYHPHAGAARHRAAGAAWATRFGLAPTPDEVLVCARAQHAVTVALTTLTSPGDRVLTEALTFPGMRQLANLLHLRLEGIAMDDEGLRPDALEEALRAGPAAKVLYCMPSLQNPTTGVLSESRRHEIVALARAHDLTIVEDDVHRLLVPDAPAPLARLAPERGCYVAGTSKSIAGGLRIGFLIAPPSLVDRLALAIWATVWMASPLAAELVALWIEDGTADRVVERKRREAAARQRIARAVLGHLSYRTQPHAFHVWLELPDPWRSEAFAAEARRRGVLIAPAEAFAVGRGVVPHAVRVSLSSAKDRTQLETGLTILADILSRPPTLARSIV